MNIVFSNINQSMIDGGKKIFSTLTRDGSGAFVILVGEKIGRTNYEKKKKKEKKVNVRS